MEEIWRDIPGYEGLYQASIDRQEGRCRSLNYKNTGVIKQMNTNPNLSDGRIYWVLTKDGVHKGLQAARWIAITYPEYVQNEYFEGAEIDHIDGDRLNNHPLNLRWVTRKENMNNPVTRKQHTKDYLETERRDKCVWQYSLDNVFIAHYLSIEEAQKRTGVNRVMITECCTGERISAGGFIWRYGKEV